MSAAALPTHLVLDRDGVLNDESRQRYVLSPADWRWLPGAREAILQLAAAGASLAIATNQSAVGRGLLPRSELDAIHRLAFAELPLDFVLVCPHGPDAGCACRKPAPGMLLEAAARWGIAPESILTVGDAARDLEASRRAAAPCALVLTGKGRKTAAALDIGGASELWGGAPFEDLAALAAAWCAAREAAPGGDGSSRVRRQEGR